MFKTADISKFLRILILIFSVCFLLTACNGSETPDSKQNGNANTQVAMNADGAPQPSANELSQEQRQCWQSGILDLMYKQAGSISLGLYQYMTEGALAFMMVAFSVWFAFRLLRHVGSFQEENIAEIWKEVFKQLFICFACGILASSETGLLFILNNVIFPLYYTFLEFAGEMLNVAAANSGGEQTFSFLGESFKYNQNVACVPAGLVVSEKLDTFPTAPIEMMKCMACAINERLGLGFFLAFTTLNDTGIMAWIIGLIIFLIFTFIKLGFIFYLVDALFRFTIVVTIMPALVLAYAFKQTRSWANFGFMTMITSAAYMMMVAIMIAVALLAMQEIMLSPELGMATDNAEEVRQSFKEFSIPLICLLLLAFLILSTMSIAQELTEQLVGGDASGSFKDKGAKALAMVVKFFTLGIGGAALGVAKKGLSKTGKGAASLGKSAGKGIQTFLKKFKKSSGGGSSGGDGNSSGGGSNDGN